MAGGFGFHLFTPCEQAALPIFRDYGISSEYTLNH
jgi:hypothetical protein